MYRKILPISFGIILLLAFAGSAFALRTPGVYPGDWAIYDIVVEWSSTDPSQTCPPSLLELNKMEWIKFDFPSVMGTNITGQMITHFENGSETIQGGWVDIDSGQGENMTIWVIAANLHAGDTLYTSGYYYTWIINETIMKMYQGLARWTNHFNLTAEKTDSGNYTCNSFNFYWDQQTGIIVKINQSTYMETISGITSASLAAIITETNRWIVPEFPTSSLILTAFIATSSFAILFKHRKFQNKNR